MNLSRSSGGIETVQRVAAVICQYPGMELTQVEGHRVQEGFGKHVGLAAPKEAAEAVVLFENAERALGLDGAVYAQTSALLAGDAR